MAQRSSRHSPSSGLADHAILATFRLQDPKTPQDTSLFAAFLAKGALGAAVLLPCCRGDSASAAEVASLPCCRNATVPVELALGSTAADSLAAVAAPSLAEDNTFSKVAAYTFYCHIQILLCKQASSSVCAC